MRNMRDCIAALVGAALVTLAVPAHAQKPDARADAAAGEDADARARALYRQGDRLYVQGKYEEAIEAFQESYRLSGRPLILYAIANAYERLGRYEEALRALRQYEPHARPGEEQDLQERMRSLEERQAAQERAQAVPDGAIGGAPAAAGDVQRPLAGWILAGAGATSLAAGAVFGLIARNAENDIGDRCQGAGNDTLCLADAEPLIDRNRRYARFADVSVGVGAAALAAGIVVLVTGSERAPAERPVLSFGPGHLEVGYVGRF